MLNKIINTVKQVKSDIEEIQYACSPHHINMYFTQEMYKGIPVYTCNRTVTMFSKLPSRIPSAFAGNMEDGTQAIFVNEAMKASDKDVYDAVLSHEYGHIVLGHLNEECELSTLHKELEADNYALENGYDIKKALKVIRKAMGRGVIDIHGMMRTRLHTLESY